jgi:hypothetical protein
MICSMKLTRTSTVLGCLAVVLLSIATNAQQAGHILKNDDVVKMTRDGFDEAVTVALVESNPTEFDVSINGLTALKAAGFTGKVMEAMLKAEAKKRQASGRSSVAPSQPSATAQNAPPAAMVPNPAMSAMGGGNLQQMMAMGRGGMAGGMLDTSQLPQLTLIKVGTRQQIRPSVAQIANTQTQGDGMPGVGSQATGTLMGLGRQALSFGAIGRSMFAGPGGPHPIEE